MPLLVLHNYCYKISNYCLHIDYVWTVEERAAEAQLVRLSEHKAAFDEQYGIG